ncbi:lytic transglycosylase domain-containing protein [Azospirillum thermophilum]|uniref:lytic transglycosylase domain-containing protein n=1 Tax=Azospirillum thermophilum TaxID=2202148 RepID=UPI001FE741BD|nr:lytic transglycosylase domain-containing protein [Azospirillum thermophilum]
MGIAVVLAAAPDGLDGYRPARAALVIHAPDGRPVTPPGHARADQPLLLATDEEARAVQLGEEDAGRYRRIFLLQERAEWDAADAEIRQLSDTRLLGYVLRQRYLHPDRRASYEELAGWMQRYADHAGAERVHGLAQRRQPAGQRPPKAPNSERGERLSGSLERLGGLRTVSEKRAAEKQGADRQAGEERTDEAAPSPIASGEESVTVAPRSRTVSRPRTDRAAIARIEDLLRSGKPGPALSLLNQDEFGRSLDTAQYDLARSRIAAALYYAGDVGEALSLASASASRSGQLLPEAHWIAGLAAYRLKQVDRASRHFDAMAAGAPRSPWLAAAGHYWAARMHKLKGRNGQAGEQLLAAARYSHTFYGLVALRALGDTGSLRWQAPELSGRQLKALAERPEGLRAIALLQADQRDLAEMELQRIHPKGNALIEQALVTLADRAGLPALSLQIGNAVAGPDGAPYAAALYPLPHWKPRDGFALDRALVFAVMRQESRFDPRLVSSAGATGLMQIMPATAQHVQERNADIGDADTDRSALFDPARNMELGQRYLAELLTMPEIGGNLFLAAAAYNAGPGTLMRWRRDLSDVTDPLLFIESLPFAETRDYVEKVLANFWIYRLRLGQETASLDAVAAGGWPVYIAEDKRPAVEPTLVATKPPADLRPDAVPEAAPVPQEAPGIETATAAEAVPQGVLPGGALSGSSVAERETATPDGSDAKD